MLKYIWHPFFPFLNSFGHPAFFFSKMDTWVKPTYIRFCIKNVEIQKRNINKKSLRILELTRTFSSPLPLPNIHHVLLYFWDSSNFSCINLWTCCNMFTLFLIPNLSISPLANRSSLYSSLDQTNCSWTWWSIPHWYDWNGCTISHMIYCCLRILEIFFLLLKWWNSSPFLPTKFRMLRKTLEPQNSKNWLKKKKKTLKLWELVCRQDYHSQTAR